MGRSHVLNQGECVCVGGVTVTDIRSWHSHRRVPGKLFKSIDLGLWCGWGRSSKSREVKSRANLAQEMSGGGGSRKITVLLSRVYAYVLEAGRPRLMGRLRSLT
jgi:hypothetical protein